MTVTRRPKGDGNVQWNDARNRWEGRLEAPPDGTGKRARVMVTAPTRTDLVRKMKVRRSELDRGVVAATTTLADLTSEWARLIVATESDGNRVNLTWAADLIAANLGGHRLDRLTVAHVETFLADAVAGTHRRPAHWKRVNVKPCGRQSVNRLLSTLRRILTWGQRRNMCATNVASLAELPVTPAGRTGRALTTAELGRLLAVGDRHQALWTVLAGLGLRPGEALGLSWSDVDFDARVVHVRSGLKWSATGEPMLAELKTARSRRSLAMPPPVAAALRARRVTQIEDRLAVGSGDTPLVFTSYEGTPLDEHNVSRSLRAVARRARITGHVTPYDLRHTCATLMADSGVPLEHIADVLGHDGTRMARMVYTHSAAPTVTAGVAAMTTALGGGR